MSKTGFSKVKPLYLLSWFSCQKELRSLNLNFFPWLSSGKHPFYAICMAAEPTTPPGHQLTVPESLLTVLVTVTRLPLQPNLHTTAPAIPTHGQPVTPPQDLSQTTREISSSHPIVYPQEGPHSEHSLSTHSTGERIPSWAIVAWERSAHWAQKQN